MRYALARLKESSTWAGLSVLLSLAGIYLEPALTESIIILGTTAAGMALALLPDGSGQRGGE
jgi:hypothetical protein